MSSSSGAFLYPSVTSLPGQSGITPAERGMPKKQEGVKSEFDEVLDKTGAADKAAKGSGTKPDSNAPNLDQIRSPLKFSAHATQRLNDRKINLDQATMTKVNDAIDKAQAKGVEDTLVLTKDAALIVNVPNRTVITAMDRNSLAGNVFTNIDGAVIV